MFHGGHLNACITMMNKTMKYFIRVALCLTLTACCALTAGALDKSYYAEHSKLASGKWVKLSVMQSGIYQITAADITRWGLGSDLSQIHVFGYGGAPLSETMLGDNYADDLPQMPVVRTADRILFYAQGPLTWQFKNITIEHQQVQHPYAISGCYFITNDSRFSDVEIAKGDTQPSNNIQTTYVERMCHEQEMSNPGETGRVFLGESFVTNKNQSYQFTLDGMLSGSNVRVLTCVGVKMSSGSATMSHSYNGQSASTTDDDLFQPTTANYTTKSKTSTFTLDGTNILKYSLNFASSGNVVVSRLDYITVNYTRTLAMKDGYLGFGLNWASRSVGYRISNAGSNTRVWDVTAPYAPIQLNTTTSDGNITFSPSENERREFVAFDESGTFPHPESLGEIRNQDIHGEPVPDMIILSPAAYLEQAQRVARLHEEVDSFRVLVLDHEKVFNEFSSGTQDAMAYRRLCKMFYDRGASDDGHRLGYLLLMGCGSYDNRLVGNDSTALNYPHLLTWQTNASDNDNSFTTDDFFGLVDDGTSADVNQQIEMKISVGRMIVKSVSEARTVVNKLVKYVSNPIYGSWKNQALHVADDENNAEHVKQDTLMVYNARKYGGNDIVYNRVYIDAFNAVSAGGSRNYPDARAKMFNALREGVLWWNYIGHASTQNWTAEGQLMRSDVETQLFYKRLPVLYAATCEFCRFDNSVLSSGEHMFLNANGGVIAAMCPARLAYVDKNGVLSGAMGRYIYSRDEKGKPRRIGDMLRFAKNATSTGDNNKRFFLFGDPAMRLAWAPYTAKIETINGQRVDGDHERIVFKAREQVEFTGKIVDINGNVATNFNGEVFSTLFGPEQSITTNGYTKKGKGTGEIITYEDRSNRLAINVDTVVGGQFTVRVIIPTEVNNEYDNYREAMINLYAYDSKNAIEAKGSNSEFYIYGYEDEEVTDTIGPEIITLGLNNETFADGSSVNESPLVLASIKDESGVNFSSDGVGHSMTLTLDGTTSYNDVVSYYTPMFIEKGTLGSISYQLSDLAPGAHTLRLRVWDVYNNVSEKTISFNVVKGLAPEIADIYSLLDGSAGETSFFVKHNRPDAVVTVTIEVYDLMGRPVWRTTQSGRSDMFTSTPVVWNLVDSGGRRVQRGIYVYRATITTDGVQVATKSKKLAVPAL